MSLARWFLAAVVCLLPASPCAAQEASRADEVDRLLEIVTSQQQQLDAQRQALDDIRAQLLQLPLIATPVFSYALHSGAFVNVFATLQSTPRLGIDWHAGSQGFVLAVAGPAVTRLGINLLALLSWLVLRLR